ncbi:glycosyltransferase family 1 protein [Spirosoma areae]
MDDLNELLESPSSTATPHINLGSGLSSTARPTDRLIKPGTLNELNDLVCFSHLRWNFVYQRPQHLLSRAARRWRVWYIEEPVWSDTPGLVVRQVSHQLSVVVPHLSHGTGPDEAIRQQRAMVDQLLSEQRIHNYALWYYTPMALSFSDHLQPRLTVFDCMDELSAFLGAPPLLIEQERRLINRADVIFTGGYSLYEAKQKRHPEVYAFPSCIDYEHFAQARSIQNKSGLGPSTDQQPGLPNPTDQQAIQGPRIGYSGVLDERLDLTLISELAHRRPDWQFVFLGPVVKINPNDLPKGPNLHYLGMKAYNDLPAYFSNWQAAMMPFAINEATRYISPTKTPEYLAAGLPVVSTPIRDVLRTYGSWDRVVIADSVSAFENGLSVVLNNSVGVDHPELDRFLREQSWKNTWEHMQRILNGHLQTVSREQ